MPVKHTIQPALLSSVCHEPSLLSPAHHATINTSLTTSCDPWYSLQHTMPLSLLKKKPCNKHYSSQQPCQHQRPSQQPRNKQYAYTKTMQQVVLITASMPPSLPITATMQQAVQLCKAMQQAPCHHRYSVQHTVLVRCLATSNQPRKDPTVP